MPRVKFSTLLTAMAGKSGGSVFSKNRGGYYFRNNKSGYKLKKINQQLSQGRFRSVSGLWGGLSTSERESWNTAAISFPSQDVFGDPKALSGYELFMKLNAAIMLRGGTPFVVPSPVRPIPPINQNYWVTEDAFLYQPKFGFTIPRGTISGDLTAYAFSGPTLSVVSGGAFFYAITVEFDDLKDALTNNFASIENQLGDISSNSKLAVQIAQASQTSIEVIFTIDYGTGVEVCNFTVNESELKNKNVFAVNRDLSGTAIFQLQVNGTPIVATYSNTSGSSAPFQVNGNLLEFTTNNSNVNFAVTDVRYMSFLPSINERDAIIQGYIFNTNQIVMQFPTFKGDVVATADKDSIYLGGSIKLNGTSIDWSEISKPVNTFNFPAISLLVEATDEVDWQMELLVSPPTSPGRNISSLPLKQVASFPISSSFNQNVSSLIRSIYPLATNGQSINMALRLVDYSNGVVLSKVETEKKGNVQRFKAGSELSGRVKVP